MTAISTETIIACKEKLIRARGDLLNRIRLQRVQYQSQDFGGDEGDLSSHAIAEHEFVINQNRVRQQLVEIDFALARIEKGEYGICEETGEAIEANRLLALPWTRLSIEGAELRERTNVSSRSSF